MITAREISRKGLAALLSVTISGFALLVCCGASSAAGRDSCPLTRAAGHCNKAKAAAPAPSINSSTLHASAHCSSLQAIFDKARKLEKGQTATQPSKVELPSTVFDVPTKNSQVFFHYSSYKPNRNKSYLKHRVFRI